MLIRISYTLAMVFALLAASLTAGLAQRREELQEQAERSFPLAAGGQISLESISGNVQITAWDRQEVKIAATKRAYAPERLKEVEIDIDTTPESIRIRTSYPNKSRTWQHGEEDKSQNSASVDYVLSVPRGISLSNVQIINGDLMLDGISGNVRAGSINGQLTARNLGGEARLSTVNGRLEASFSKLNDAGNITLNSVNGNIVLTIPSDANAQVRANTVGGMIANDFGLPVRRGSHVGRDLAGLIGKEGANIRLSNVHGQISILRSQDNRPVSPSTNLLPERSQEDFGEETRRAAREAERAMRAAEIRGAEAGRSIEAARRVSERERIRVERELAMEARRLEREKNRIEREAGVRRTIVTEREEKQFPLTGSATPRVTIENFDGSITVRSSERPEVSYKAVKRGGSAEEMGAIRFRAEQQGDSQVSIIAEFDDSKSNQLNSQASVQMEVFVPRNANLRISAHDGRVSVEGVSGEAELTTGDGTIYIKDGRGRFRITTGDGRITVSNFDGALEARAGDGRITLDGRFTQLTAETGNGSISLSTPPDFNATIETSAEFVSSDSAIVAEDSDNTKRVRRWRVGNGSGNILKLQTGEGRIVLRTSAGGAGTNAASVQ